jgi:hypothetical protein
VWTELSGRGAIDVYRRNLQRAYVERMEYMMTNELPNIPASFRQFIGWTQVNVSQSDIRAMVREQLETLESDVKRAKGRISDRATVAHLNDIEKRIDLVLNPE